MYNRSLFIFRRDLRIYDNNGLFAALKKSKEVIACFIFDPRQVGPHNPYRSKNAIEFMIASLKELDLQLRQQGSQLYLFHGQAPQIVQKIIESEKIDAVFCNRDYTPFSITRDEAIKKVCYENACAFESFSDLLLHEPEQVLNGNHEPYSIFTAFYKKSLLLPVAKPVELIPGTFFNKKITESHGPALYQTILSHLNPQLLVKGGRLEAIEIIKNIKKLSNYANTRDYPTLNTSHLSAHLKFGTISIREAYWHIADILGAKHTLLRQLYWRDFFTHVAYNSPYVFGHAFHEKYDKVPWKNDERHFSAWCQGKTGFPIVDAGMRELNETGWMHNRVRMIVASFLTKDLHIDWLLGEKYFAQQLVDYDPAVNNCNWQWSASTGCDAQPYFRIFNPWLQQVKFDPECIYIKKWVPELRDVSARDIHRVSDARAAAIKNYPKPIVDHALESAKAKSMYKHVTP